VRGMLGARSETKMEYVPIRSRSTIAIKAAFSLLNCFNYISFDAHCSKYTNIAIVDLERIGFMQHQRPQHSAGHDVNVYFQGIPMNCFNYISFDAHCSKYTNSSFIKLVRILTATSVLDLERIGFMQHQRPQHSAGHDVNVYFQGIPKARERYAWSQVRNIKPPSKRNVAERLR
jgi:hypothetical protein